MRYLKLLLLVCLLPLSSGFCQEDEKIYLRALDAVRTGDNDSAFMSLHALVSGFPGSRRSEEALFALGEYYFGVRDFRDASRCFYKLAQEYPGSEAEIFCFGYLLEIARRQGQEAQARALESLLIDSRRLIFVFEESKEFEYASLFGKPYKAVYTIDKVEIYANGTLLTSVSY